MSSLLDVQADDCCDGDTSHMENVTKSVRGNSGTGGSGVGAALHDPQSSPATQSCPVAQSIKAYYRPGRIDRIDLGTYPDQRSASRAVQAVARMMTGGSLATHSFNHPASTLADINPWDVVRSLQLSKIVAPDAFPRWVGQVRAGRRRRFIRFRGRAVVGGIAVRTPRVYRDSYEAWRVVVAMVREELSRQMIVAGGWLFHPRTGLPGWACRVRRDDLPKYVRRVKGGAYQARPWVGPGKADNVNLGLFHPEDFEGDRDAAIGAAKRAANEFVKRMSRVVPCGAGGERGERPDVWAVIKELQGVKKYGVPVVPGHVLPPKVRRMDDGRFGVRGRCWGEVVGVYESPEEAWEAVKGGVGRAGSVARHVVPVMAAAC